MAKYYQELGDDDDDDFEESADFRFFLKRDEENLKQFYLVLTKEGMGGLVYMCGDAYSFFF